MPDFFPIPDWLILARTMARMRATVGIRTKRQRRAVPYTDELLAKAAGKVNYGKLKRR